MKIIIVTLLCISALFASKVSVFKVEGMHCPLCTTAVKKAVRNVNGVEKVSAKLNTKEVTVHHEENVSIEEILKAIKTTSYEGILIK